ncbi:MAG TPA: SMP-30/gluconolactonase/LRE family protein [Sphingobium sp.]
MSSVATDIQRIADIDNHLGETPIWSVPEQALWWVNCERPPALHRLDPESGQHDVWPMPRRIGGFVAKAAGGLLVVLADGLYDFDPADGSLALRVRSGLPDHVALHECHCDRQGRLWVGAYDHHYPADRGAADGFLHRLDGDRLTRVIDGVAISNSLAISPDGRTLYASGPAGKGVEAFDLDPATGALSNRRPFVKLSAGFADGATVDTQGGYWLAVVGIGELHRYHPDGTLDRIIALPCSNPTKPAFGGPDLGTLYVTSTKMVIKPDHPGNAANGGLFALRPGEHGVAEVPLA